MKWPYFFAEKVIHGTEFAVNNSAPSGSNHLGFRKKALKNEKNAEFLLFF
jgi:hypothetical protein